MRYQMTQVEITANNAVARPGPLPVPTAPPYPEKGERWCRLQDVLDQKGRLNCYNRVCASAVSWSVH